MAIPTSIKQVACERLFHFHPHKRIATISRSTQRGAHIIAARQILAIARSTYYHDQHKTPTAQEDER